MEFDVFDLLSVTEARDRFAEITGRVRFAGERIVLEEQGKAVAALVSTSDLEALKAELR